jgi:hypothetical protein
VTNSAPTVVPEAFHASGTAPAAEPTRQPTLDQLAAFRPVTAREFAALRTAQPDYFDWLDHIEAAAACTRPVRLAGDLYTVRRSGDGTATVVATGSTATMPDGLIYKACGNRRATVCPACARTYQRDAYQLLRAGLVGGKGVAPTVARHPAVFATLTAPSFGTVHTRNVSKHTCTNRRRCDCRPDPCHARRAGTVPGLCPHGQPTVCWARHDRDDRLGRPLCLDCYDHDHQVVWNLHAGELWRRTKQAVERHLATLARQRGIPRVVVGFTPAGKPRTVPPVRVSHGKAAEFQVRGVVHFHALLRLDGVDPRDPAAVVPPPAGFTAADLVDAVHAAVRQVAYTTPAHPDRPAGWSIVWGDPDKGLDVRPITLAGRGEVTDEMVAGYLAKYATKSTEVTGHRSTRLDGDTIDEHADPNGDHTARLIAACWRLGRPTRTPAPDARAHFDRPTHGLRLRWTCPGCGTQTVQDACPECARSAAPPAVVNSADCQPEVGSGSANGAESNPFPRLRRWAHMLGFGGHFLTKNRRYSFSFKFLRDKRIVYRRAEQRDDQVVAVIRTADHTGEETTLVVGLLTYAGSGWHTTGDALLANTAAAMARARREAARDELAHEIGTTRTGATPAAA